MYNPTILMGVELEVEIVGDPNPLQHWESKHKIYGSYPKHVLLGNTHKKHGSIAQAVDETCEDQITTHYDNTINDGFEWIGSPMSMRENKRLWGLLLTNPKIAPYIQGENVKVTQGTYGIHDVGMHVHVSGDPITPLVLGKVYVFINSKGNKTFLECVAGRKLNKFCEIQVNHKITNVAHLYHTATCTKRTKRGSKIRLNLNGGFDCTVPSTGAFCCGSAAKLAGKFGRGAMWVTPAMNAGDYEIRIFKSTVKVDKFNANLEFCVAIIDFCQQASMKDLTSKAFGEWLSSLTNRLKYPYLFKLMRSEGYTKGIIPKSTSLQSMIAKGKLPVRAMSVVE